MAEKKERCRPFSVNAWVQALVTVTVEAKSYAEAEEKAKALDVTDFVKILGEYQDGRAPRISWISDDENGDPAD